MAVVKDLRIYHPMRLKQVEIRVQIFKAEVAGLLRSRDLQPMRTRAWPDLRTANQGTAPALPTFARIWADSSIDRAFQAFTQNVGRIFLFLNLSK
jgi:hypothetical protein